MKAVLTDRRFSDPGWIFERKLDGIRCLAFKAEKQVRLRSRNDLSLNGRFPEIVAALEDDPVADVVLDGEIVAFDGAQTSFARLQQRGERPTPVFFYVFDILRVAGDDVTEEPLRARKALLRRALAFADPIRFTAHRNGDGEAFFAEACRKGWEGLIAKRADAPYAHGPFAGLAEVQVLGRAGARHRRLYRYALVAQVGFSEWTRDRRLRHPRFLGLRDDKAAGDVVREDVNPAATGPA